MMSLLKSVPEGLKPQECERTKLCEPLPVPYVPTKDEVQEEVAKLRNPEIKTTIKKDTTLNFPVWHENGTRKAFLMHVMAVLDAIKKWGHFQDREDVVAELILMVSPLYCIMSVAMLNYKWCLALRSVLGTSGVWPK
jgi:hypothetical protein